MELAFFCVRCADVFARPRRLKRVQKNIGLNGYRNFYPSFWFSVVAVGVYAPVTVFAQSAPPASLLNPQPPVSVALDPKYVGTTVMQLPAPPAPIQVALAQKYSAERKIAPTAVVAPQFPGSPVPVRHPFLSAPLIAMGKPIVNPTYQADVVNEPMVDTSRLPLQMPAH